MNIDGLVGGFNPSEKYSSVDIIVPNLWKNKKCSKPPTSGSIVVTSIYFMEYIVQGLIL